ncbi:hypothetical protein BV898_16897 [Hypsibius exemplaris]|uniref:Uncharacterized protein n=1 Tax=Hypsibius exemplaris TaxID=2072580 RepID=A0A9X6RLI0_HYPEX|nr:hypothetical protein BV898_16897 [Hypsibius exemplaris]
MVLNFKMFLHSDAVILVGGFVRLILTVLLATVFGRTHGILNLVTAVVMAAILLEISAVIISVFSSKTFAIRLSTYLFFIGLVPLVILTAISSAVLAAYPLGLMFTYMQTTSIARALVHLILSLVVLVSGRNYLWHLFKSLCLIGMTCLCLLAALLVAVLAIFSGEGSNRRLLTYLCCSVIACGWVVLMAANLIVTSIFLTSVEEGMKGSRVMALGGLVLLNTLSAAMGLFSLMERLKSLAAEQQAEVDLGGHPEISGDQEWADAEGASGDEH